MSHPATKESEQAIPESDSRDERIQIRRDRIKTRIEAARREALGEQPRTEEDDEKEVDKDRRSKKQVEESSQRLEKLTSDGTQLVTNVLVAGDAKEVQRRLDEDETKKTRVEKLEAEANASIERFEEIMRRWEPALAKTIPQDLQEKLAEQKTACDAMRDEKDKLINDFQQELKTKDDQYVRDLKKQAEDVDLILERMEDQVKTIMKGFREELEEIEKAFVAERAALLQQHIGTWDKEMERRRKIELDYLKERERRIDDHEQQLQHLRQQNAEEYKKIMMTFEKEIQALQQQIEQMKATFQLNAEKLEYNFHVLKKRDEENMITISQQKRKITKLQDVLTNLRKKLSKQEEQYQVESVAITEEYRKNSQQFADLQKKYKLFQAADAKKFEEIWEMAEETVRDLATVVQQGENCIYKQQLGLDCESLQFPESPMAQEATVVQEGSESVSQALQYVASILSGESDSHTTIVEGKFSPSLIQRALKLICQESSFLIEEKLLRLLAPLDEDEQLLMKLDSIFKALLIDTEEGIHKLVEYCCVQVCIKCTLYVGVSILFQESTTADHDEEVDKTDDAMNEGISLVHPNHVAQALRQFAEQRKNLSKPVSAAATSRAYSTHKNAKLLDGKFWEDMSKCALQDDHEKVADALLMGLEKYHTVLESRRGLIQETGQLKQQNTELKLLLHQYMHAKINKELEVPPTHMMINENTVPLGVQ